MSERRWSDTQGAHPLPPLKRDEDRSAPCPSASAVLVPLVRALFPQE